MACTSELSECVYVDAVRALKRIKGRWKTPLLAALAEEPRRWSDLRRLFPALTPKMLTQQLSELERDGVIVRDEFVSDAPKVVIYSLSSLGERVRPLLAALVAWGREVAASGDAPSDVLTHAPRIAAGVGVQLSR